MSSDALALVVGDGLLMAGTIAAAMLTRSRVRADLDKHTTEVGRRFDVVEAQQTERQAQLIRDAVEQVAAEHPGMVSNAVATEAVRYLLDAMLSAQLDDDDRPSRIRR